MPVYLRGSLPGSAGLGVAVALLLASCEPAEPAVELGTGLYAFEPLVEGEPIEVVFGPQGGYHLEGSIRVQGLQAGDAESLSDPSNPTIRFEVLLDGESILLSGDYTQGLEVAPVEDRPWSHQMIGRRVILDIEDDDPLVDEQVELSVEVADVDGTVVSDLRLLVVEKHPSNDTNEF